MSTFEELEKTEQEAEAVRAAMYAEESEPVVEVKPEDDKPVESAVIDEGVAGAGDEGIAIVEDEPVVEVKSVEVIPKKEDEEETFKKRFQIMEGKYKAEVPRLSSELAQWKEYASNLQSRVTVLEETTKAKPSTPLAEDEPDYEVEAFVSDNPGAAKLINKMKAEHKAELASLRDEIKFVDQKTVAAKSEFQQTTAIGQFDKAMTDAGVSDWRTIDVDPGFMEWLNRSPYNVKVLQAAASQFDAPTVASYFLDYKKSLAPSDNGGDPVIDVVNQDKLGKFTAPPRGGGATIPSKTPAQPVLTKESYVKFSNEAMTPGGYNPARWGGKTVAQMDAIFDAAIARNFK